MVTRSGIWDVPQALHGDDSEKLPCTSQSLDPYPYLLMDGNILHDLAYINHESQGSLLMVYMKILSIKRYTA